MTWWDKLKRIARREAAAVREEVGKAANTLDEALARKERERDATPAERVDMILDEIEAEDTRLDEIEERLRGERATPPASAGVDPDPRLESVRNGLAVASGEPDGAVDRTGLLVTLEGSVRTSLGEAGFDGVIDDLRLDVMVLDASRDGDSIALRAPTLDETAVADLVARAVVARLPAPSTPEVDPAQAATDDQEGPTA